MNFRKLSANRFADRVSEILKFIVEAGPHPDHNLRETNTLSRWHTFLPSTVCGQRARPRLEVGMRKLGFAAAGIAAILIGGQANTAVCSSTIYRPSGDGTEPFSALGAGVCVQAQYELFSNFSFGTLPKANGTVTFDLEGVYQEDITSPRVPHTPVLATTLPSPRPAPRSTPCLPTLPKRKAGRRP
jgi:hypothetical protein